MGWWHAARDGDSLQSGPTGLAWGDGPADLLDDALNAITKEFQENLGRPPTNAELRAGLEFSLLGNPDDATYPPEEFESKEN